MSISTKIKTEYLNRYCKRNLRKWREKISPNIVGVHVGYKKCGGRKTNRFSIVFHVKQKLEYPISHIPKTFNLTINKQKVAVPTDVIETGSTRLMNVLMGDKARSKNIKNEFGSAGLFISIQDDVYVISNMHVLAPQRLADRFYTCPKSEQFFTDVECFNETDTQRAFLEKAAFDGIDLAMARFQFPNNATFKIRDLGQPAKFLKQSEIKVGMRVQMFGASTNAIVQGTVEATSVSRFVEYDSLEVQIDDLIATSLPVIDGDSGSAVVNDFMKIAGVLVSADRSGFSYVIPSFEIEKFITNT